MTDICFATNNQHKLVEVKNLLGNEFNVLSLEDIGCSEELPENQSTLEGNSLEKAKYVLDHYQINCFADDTGLEVEALGGAPGVYSARYAGPQKNNEENISLLLKNLATHKNRKAQFRTVFTLFYNQTCYQFEGVVKGKIINEKKGDQGFGYDPVFVPDHYDKTFAEMPLEEKGIISHRGIATRKLVEFLKKR